MSLDNSAVATDIRDALERVGYDKAARTAIADVVLDDLTARGHLALAEDDDDDHWSHDCLEKVGSKNDTEIVRVLVDKVSDTETLVKVIAGLRVVLKEWGGEEPAPQPTDSEPAVLANVSGFVF